MERIKQSFEGGYRNGMAGLEKKIGRANRTTKEERRCGIEKDKDLRWRDFQFVFAQYKATKICLSSQTAVLEARQL